MATWDMIRTERAALADALGGLSPDAWNHRSLATDWTVRDVVAHLIATAEFTPPTFFAAMIGSGFRFGAMVTKRIASVESGASDADLVARYGGLVDARSGPPGPTMSWLGESIVHGEDVFRALGTPLAHPIEHVVAAADFYKGSDLLIGAKKRIAGVCLRATDTEWTYGTGPEASGPMIALLLAMTGRQVALDDLAGPGVQVLRGRG